MLKNSSLRWNDVALRKRGGRVSFILIHGENAVESCDRQDPRETWLIDNEPDRSADVACDAQRPYERGERTGIELGHRTQVDNMCESAIVDMPANCFA